jgi:hypothetical protein
MPPKPEHSELAARCHEIQVSLGTTDVPEFDRLVEIGMAVRLALHIRGLPLIKYDVLRLVANHYLDIPTTSLRTVLNALAEVEFVRIVSEGSTIKSVLPTVPYYEDMYTRLGEYGTAGQFTEAEQLSLDLVNRLSRSPNKIDSLRNETGAEVKLFDRAIKIGEEGRYLIRRRARGRDVILSPTYFSENSALFADLVAKSGAGEVQRVLAAVKNMQGIPLAIAERTGEIAGEKMSPEQLLIVQRLAQDGAIKPPTIKTTYAGENHFLFTPTPTGAALAPTKRDIYERAMAIVAAVRQGQFLSNRYAIRYPRALIAALRDRKELKRASTEATQQYRQLVHLRIGQLVPAGGDYARFKIIDTPENEEALKIAYDLVAKGSAQGIEVDAEARNALQQDQQYVESIVGSASLRARKKVELSQELQSQMDLLFLQ